MSDEEYQEQIDEAVDQGELQQEYQENLVDQGDAQLPALRKEDSLYTLFWKIINRSDSTKVANLKKEEIGDTMYSVRDAKRLAMLGQMFGNPLYQQYFKNFAEITNATSMSRDGWLGELFVSQKKYSTRARRHNSTSGGSGWMFNRNKNQQPQEQQ